MRSFNQLVSLLILLVYTQTGLATTLSVFQGSPKPPKLILKDVTGNLHDLNNYRNTVVLINFWASWCPPCVKELPSLQRLQLHYRNKPFVILTVDIGEDENTIKQFLQTIDPVQLTILMDKNARAHTDWKIYVFPTSFLIDKKGNVRYGAVGALEWDNNSITTIINSLLSEEEGNAD